MPNQVRPPPTRRAAPARGRASPSQSARAGTLRAAPRCHRQRPRKVWSRAGAAPGEGPRQAHRRRRLRRGAPDGNVATGERSLAAAQTADRGCLTSARQSHPAERTHRTHKLSRRVEGLTVRRKLSVNKGVGMLWLRTGLVVGLPGLRTVARHVGDARRGSVWGMQGEGVCGGCKERGN
eukprot:143702-Chlamydomonas_euryale.AAC.1